MSASDIWPCPCRPCAIRRRLGFDDALRAEVARLNALDGVRCADIERLHARLAQNDSDWTALRAEVAALRETLDRSNDQKHEAMRELAQASALLALWLEWWDADPAPDEDLRVPREPTVAFLRRGEGGE